MNVTERLSQAITDEGGLNTYFVNPWPAGTLVASISQLPPIGCINTHGGAFSRTIYSQLFTLIGTKYGAGDGKTTFNVPDLRGYSLRVWDAGRGIDKGRAFGTFQEDAIRNITGGFNIHSGEVASNLVDARGAMYGTVNNSKYKAGGEINTGANSMQYILLDASRVVPVAPENRMKNFAASLFISYGAASPAGGGVKFPFVFSVLRRVLDSFYQAFSVKRGAWYDKLCGNPITAFRRRRLCSTGSFTRSPSHRFCFKFCR